MLLIWCATVVPLFALGDQATVAFYRSDTERVARLYGQGALPPGCRVGLPFRAHPETDLECRGSVASVAAFYRSRLAPGWVETRPPGQIKFEKSPDEFVIVFERTGTKVVVSPTAW